MSLGAFIALLGAQASLNSGQQMALDQARQHNQQHVGMDEGDAPVVPRTEEPAAGLPDECCATCRFWRLDERLSSVMAATYECRRSAPSPRGWRHTRAGDWCGDYAAQPSAADDEMPMPSGCEPR